MRARIEAYINKQRARLGLQPIAAPAELEKNKWDEGFSSGVAAEKAVNSTLGPVERNATVDRCVQLVTEWHGVIEERELLLARIRELKDQP